MICIVYLTLTRTAFKIATINMALTDIHEIQEEII